jgi:hypothetical protein
MDERALIRAAEITLRRAILLNFPPGPERDRRLAWWQRRLPAPTQVADRRDLAHGGVQTCIDMTTDTTPSLQEAPQEKRSLTSRMAFEYEIGAFEFFVLSHARHSAKGSRARPCARPCSTDAPAVIHGAFVNVSRQAWVAGRAFGRLWECET